MMAVLFLVSTLLVVQTCLAGEIWEEDSATAAANLLSIFDSQLQDAIFQALDSQERSRRATQEQDVWTGFVPNLNQQREQLVVDSLQIVSSPLLCPDSTINEEKIFDLMRYRHRDYLLVACDNQLMLYELTLTSPTPIYNISLDMNVLALKHFKLIDPKSGNILLFVMLLTPTRLEIYRLNKDVLAFSNSLQLIQQFRSVQIFNFQNSVYFLLLDPSADGQVSPGIYKLDLDDSQVSIHLATSLPFSEDSFMQICIADGQARLFRSDRSQNQLEIYSIDDHQMDLYQTFEAEGIQDFKCFSMGATHYLVFSTFTAVKILKFVDGLYKDWQTLPFTGVSAIHPLSPPTYRDDTLIFIGGFNPVLKRDFVDFLVFDAMSLKFTPFNSTCSKPIDWNTLPITLKASDVGCLADIEDLDISSIGSTVLNGQLLSIVPLQLRSLFILLNVHLDPVSNPVLAQHSQVHERVEATASAAQQFRDRTSEFYEFSKGIVFYDSDVKLEGSWTIDTVQVPEISLDNISQNNVDFNQEFWIPGLDVIVDDIQTRMSELEQMINGIDRYLQGTIQNGTEDPISLERLRVDGSLFIKQLEVTQLSVEQLNGLDFGPLMNDIVRRDSNRMIESLSVMGSMTIDTLSAERVNNISINDIVLRSEPNVTINGNLTVHNQLAVTGNVTVDETINQLNLSQIITLNDHFGSIIFADNTSVDYFSVQGYLNGFNASQVFSSIIVNQSIDARLGKVRFDNLIIEGDLNLDSGFVNDVNIAVLNSSALRLDSNQLIEGPMIFAGGVEVQDFLKVGSLNGVQFGKFLVRGSDLDEVVMTGTKNFLGPVTSREVKIGQKVNGHSLGNALSLDTNQNVTSPVKLLNGFEVPTGNLQIEKLNEVDWNFMRVKGVHPALLKQRGLKKNVTIRNLASIGGSLTTDQLMVNGENLDGILNDLVYASEDDIVISGRKNFSSLKVKGLQVDGYINGMKLLEEILVSSTDQSITGHYQFQNYVDFSSLDVNGDLNGYNLTELFGSVLLLDDELEAVTCRLKFNHVSVSDQILVNGSINGFPTDLMVLNGVDQNFTAPQKLIYPDFSSLTIVGNLNTTDHTSLVNGLDLDLFDRRRVTLSTDQWIRGTWNLRNVSVDSISFRTLNGLSLENWNSSFIHSHSPTEQSIQAKGFNFKTLDIRGDVITLLQEISGYDLQSLEKVAGDVRRNLVFNNSVVFTHLECREIVVNGTVNNYSLHQLAKDAVFRNQSSPLIMGKKTFQNLRVNGNVEAELINGRRLIDSYLHVSADQRIEAPIKFADQVVVTDLRLVGGSATLNGVPNELLFSSHTLTHNIHKGDVIFEQPINVKSLNLSLLNEENWDQLVSSLAHLNETNQFDGTITFTNPIQVKGTLQIGDLNGVDLNSFAQDLVLKDVAANITAKKIIENLEALVLKTQHIESDSIYPDITGTAEQAIRLDMNDTVTRTIQFETIEVNRNVQVGTLNSLPFPDGFVTLDSEQELPSSSAVESIEMLGDIILIDGARVNGFDLKAEYNNTWLIDSPSKVQSNKMFHGQIQILGNLTVNRKVNGVADFGREIVSLATGGSIYGAPHFTDVTVSGNVTNVELTNDINIADLAAQALYLDSPVNTSGTWTISQASIHGGSFLLPVETTINHQVLRVGLLAGEIDSTNDTRLIKIEEKHNYEVALQWYDALRYSFYKLDHLDLNQTITLPHQVTSLSELQVNGTSFLFIGTRGGSMVYRRNSTESGYTLAGIMPDAHNVSKWLPLTPYIGSLSSTTLLWQIVSVMPFRIVQIQDYGLGVVDIVDEPIHRLRFVHNGNVTLSNPAVSSVPGMKVYERVKAPSEVSSSSSFNSDVKMHNFRLGSRSMIAIMPTLSAEGSASIVGCQGVRIFSTSSIASRLEHVIPACDVRAITSFSHGNLPDDYLVIAEHESVGVYHYEGASGFIKSFSLPYPSACAIHSWSIRSGSAKELLVAVAMGNHVSIQRSVTVGDYIDNE